MDLYIIRHAWAEDYGDPRWPTDAQRPLTAEGRERFACMVQKLADRDFAPELIATSPLVRCIETAQIVARVGGHAAAIVQREELQPGGNPEELLRWTSKQARHHEQIAWVGHAPDVARLAAALIGEKDGSIHFGKGTIAAVRFQTTPWSGHGELRWLVTAKVLGC